MQEQRHLLKSAGMISGATVLSRILGLARDVLTARLFGTSLIYDAFVIAFMIPNLLRGLMGEGSLNAAFIPVFSSYLAKGQKEEALSLANIVLTIILMTLSGCVIAVIFGVELWLHQGNLSFKLVTTLKLVQILSPYMLFICLAGLMMGVLNGFKHFVVPAFAPVILNIVWIISLFVLCPQFGDSLNDKIYGLAIGILIAGVLQFVVQVPVAKRFGFHPFQLSWNLKHPSVLKICKLMVPVIIAYAVTQINVVVDISLAYWLGQGMQSSLWYAQRILYFPLGVFGVAMSVVIMPTLSEFAAKQQFEELLDTLSYALRAVLMIILPCAVAILVLNREMVSLFYERGAFDAISVNQTAFALFCYAIGLVAFAGNKIVVPAYYAMQDTKTPVRIGIFCVLLNLVLNLVLMGPLKQGGLALATAISAFANLGILFYFLENKVGNFRWAPMISCGLKVIAISIIYGVLCWGVHKGVVYIMEPSFIRKIVEVFLPLTVAFAVTGGLYCFCGMRELYVFFGSRMK